MKKNLFSSLSAFVLSCSLVLPTSHAFDFSGADLTPVSNTLTATFEVSEATTTNFAVLSWGDGSSGQFSTEAFQPITTSVDITPNQLVQTFFGEYVTVLLKVPANDAPAIEEVDIIKNSTNVDTWYHENGDGYRYYVLGERIYVHNDGFPTTTIDLNIEFNQAGTYSFELVAVKDNTDISDVTAPTAIAAVPNYWLYQGDYFDVTFSERLNYESKAAVQNAIVNAIKFNGPNGLEASHQEDFKFTWDQQTDGTEILYVDVVADGEFNHNGSIVTTIEDLNNNSFEASITEISPL